MGIALKQEIVKSQILTKLVGIIIFILLTILGAYIYIPLPFTPVPITLQTFFVILSGAILGPHEGFLSQLGYLSLGALGLPVFSGCRGGIIHLIGPTGGYLWGFLLSSWIVGKLTHKKKRNKFLLFIFFGCGILLIYLFGLLQLNLFIKKDLFTLFQLGILPFLLPDLIKILGAVLICERLKSK